MGLPEVFPALAALEAGFVSFVSSGGTFAEATGGAAETGGGGATGAADGGICWMGFSVSGERDIVPLAEAAALALPPGTRTSATTSSI